MMDAFSIGDWILQNWEGVTALALLVGGFAFAWRRQLGRSILCFLGCFGVYVVGGLQ